MDNLKTLWESLKIIFNQVYWTFHDLLNGNPCEERDCRCDFYDDTETFRALAIQSTDPQYATRMLDTGVVGRAMTCDRCKHPRESHVRLQRRCMTADCMPNGGAVLIEQSARASSSRRAARFPKPLSAELATGSRDVVVGDGNVVEFGSQVLIRYVGKFCSDEIVFERGDELRFSVGKRQVITGLDDGVRGMRVGGTRVLTIPPMLAYGMDKSIDGRKGETLEFTVTILASVMS